MVLALVVWMVAFPNTRQDSGNPIKLGAILSMTGDAAAFGEMAQKGIDLAVEEINASGGYEGRMIEVVVEDDQTSPQEAVSAFRKLTSTDGVHAIIGPLWDFVTEPVFPLVAEEQIAMLSPSGVRIEGSFEPNEYSFLMMPEFSEIIRKLEGAITYGGFQKMAIVRFQSRFGEEIGNVLRDMMQELGREPLVEEVYDQIGSNDFRTTVLKLREAEVDGVFLDMIGVDAVNFARRAQELGLGATLLGHPTIIEELENLDADVDPALFEGAIIVNWEVSNDEFIKLFEDRYGMEPSKSANRAYDSVYILAEAITSATSLSEVATYIAANEFESLNGPTTFTEGHAAERVPIQVGVMRDGEFTLTEEF